MDGEGDPLQPIPTARNLTTQVLRAKGVPDADIGAAINDPATMQALLNQLYLRSAASPGDNNVGLGNPIKQVVSSDPSGRAATPTSVMPQGYLPFGWAGLPPLPGRLA